MTPPAVFIDPPSADFLEDRLFDASDAWLNRDGSLLPFVRVREKLRSLGSDARTADFLRRGEGVREVNHYWSLGILDQYRNAATKPGVRLRGFMQLEPPLVSRRGYRALPDLTRAFEAVYLHNTVGDGYSLSGADASKMRRLYWPQPYDDVIGPHWSRTDRQNRIVAITRNHNPLWKRPQYYGKRIEAMAALSKSGAIDLFGHGWDRWYSKQSMWPPYWLNRGSLMSIYRGTCESKLEVLAGYRFCLCIENTPMRGYVTEKLFDCLYAGTVPLYLGAPDIETLVPPDAYVDIRSFKGWGDLWESVRVMSDRDWQLRREAGKAFIRGPGRFHYFEALAPIWNLEGIL